MSPRPTTFSMLEGRRIADIRPNASRSGSRIWDPEPEEVFIETSDGKLFRMFHVQDSLEHVRMIDGLEDLLDLRGETVVLARERTQFPEGLTGTWTFYHIRTHRRDVTLRWLGESNGYYGEEVVFDEVPNPNPTM